jgi:hypothetical protein
MTVASLFSDGRNLPYTPFDEGRNYAPHTLGSSASRILKMLDGSHYGVAATALQKDLLRLWIESGAVYPGTYAALGTGMVGDNETSKAAGVVMDQRCDACHNQPGRWLPHSLSDERGVAFWQPKIVDPRLNTSRHIVFNLSRPEKSLILLAPLAESAGGWGLCRDPKTKERVTVFASTDDPDYQKLLAMCVAGEEQLERIKRFDMPGFHPSGAWAREMIRYGILPFTLKPTDPLDVYALEEQYWKSLSYEPAQTSAESNAR